MCAWSEAKKLWPEDRIVVLSVGSGELVQRLTGASTKIWTKFQWLAPTLSAMFDGQSDAVHYQLSQLYAAQSIGLDDTTQDYLRLQTDLNHAQNDKLDNVHPMNLMGLKADADQLVRSRINAIDDFLLGAFKS